MTHDNRVKIGFPPEYRDWQSAPAAFSEHGLTISGHPVMEDWEDIYMKELAGVACSRGGRVLEVGFGMGIAARYVQAHPITEHVIIEANRDVYHHLMAFAGNAAKPVLPMLGFWQEVASRIADGSVSGILFDTYPLTEREIHCNHFEFFAEAFRLLRPDGVLTYYSDEIDDFSPKHRRRLQAAGFTRWEKRVCCVHPPEECLYWKSDTIMVPIVYK